MRSSLVCVAALLILSGCGRPAAAPSSVAAAPAPSAAQPDRSEAAASDSASTSVAAGDPSKDVGADLGESAAPPTDAENRTERPAEESGAGPASVRSIVEQVANGVVYITCQDALGETTGLGSGCVVGRDGLVITNFHVLARAATAFVQLRGGTRYEILGYRGVDRRHDLALLQLEEKARDLEVFSLNHDGRLEQGDELIAIGHPSGFKFTVTTGIVSAVREAKDLPSPFQESLGLADDTLWIQTNAAISGGNSGGPLLARDGRLVGINTWVAPGQNLGFAVHVRHLARMAKKRNDDVRPLPLPGTGVVSSVEVARVARDFQLELQTLMQNMRAAGSREEAERIAEQQNPFPEYLDRFLKVSRENAGAPADFEALMSACGLATDATPRCVALVRAVLERLREEHLEDERLEYIAMVLQSRSRLPLDEATDFLRHVFRESPHREVRGVAGLSLANLYARNEAWHPEAAAMYARLAREYGDVQAGGQLIAETAELGAFGFRHLGTGLQAAEIEGKDFQGETFRLSDYRGKVVVLDFWADWCPHCRNMYPHERALVEKYRDQPFAILGVNGDDRPRAERVIAEGAVTWRSWVDGRDGPIAKQWQVSSWPTIYVLDRDGVIRYENVRGEELDAAIEHLLREPLLELPQDLIASGDVWKYRDDGAAPADDWRSVDFDDSGWKEGAGPLGYGQGRAATVVDYGDVDSKHVTTYFRKDFEVDDPSKVEQLIVGLKIDDGAAVYLNGQEVIRSFLPAAARHDTLAWEQTSHFLHEPLYFRFAPARHLRPGKNTLAVEVHQSHAFSADLHFDLTLSSGGVDPQPLLASPSPKIRAAYCYMAGALATTTDPRAVESLRQLLDDEDELVRSWAHWAVGMHAEDSRPVELPAAQSPTEADFRSVLSELCSVRSWSVLKSPDRTRQQFERAWRYARAALRLTPDDAQTLTILAVASYRLGRYEDALQLVQKSIDASDKHPVDAALIAMSQQQLGNVEEAAKAMKQLETMITREEWRDDEVVAAFHAEALKLIGPIKAP